MTTDTSDTVILRKDDILLIANQLHYLRRNAQSTVHRHAQRLGDILDDIGILVRDPTGEAYDDTRTDCDATVSEADGTPRQAAIALRIVTVVKPLVYLRRGDELRLLQRAIVVAAPDTAATPDTATVD